MAKDTANLVNDVQAGLPHTFEIAHKTADTLFDVQKELKKV